MKLDPKYHVSGGEKDLEKFYEELDGYDAVTKFENVNFDDKLKVCLCSPKSASKEDEQLSFIILNNKTIQDFNAGQLPAFQVATAPKSTFGDLADLVQKDLCLLLANGQLNVLSEAAYSQLTKNAGIAGGKFVRSGMLTDMFLADRINGEVMLIKKVVDGVNFVTAVQSTSFGVFKACDLKPIIQAVLPLTQSTVENWSVSFDTIQILIKTKTVGEFSYGISVVSGDTSPLTLTPTLIKDGDAVCFGNAVKLDHRDNIEIGEVFLAFGSIIKTLDEFEAKIKALEDLGPITKNRKQAVLPDNEKTIRARIDRIMMKIGSSKLSGKKEDTANEIIEHLPKEPTHLDLFKSLCDARVEVFKDDKDTPFLKDKHNLYKSMCYEFLQTLLEGGKNEEAA